MASTLWQDWFNIIKNNPGTIVNKFIEGNLFTVHLTMVGEEQISNIVYSNIL